jgi:hypothetical protein
MAWFEFESDEEREQRIAKENAKEERERGWYEAQERIKNGSDHVGMLDSLNDYAQSDDFKTGRDAAYEQHEKEEQEKRWRGEIESPFKLFAEPTSNSSSSNDDSCSSPSDDYSWTGNEHSTASTDSSPASWLPEPSRDYSRRPKPAPAHTTHSNSTASAETQKKKDDDAMYMLILFLSPILIVAALVVVYFEQQKRDAQTQKKPGIVQARPIPGPGVETPRPTPAAQNPNSPAFIRDRKTFIERYRRLLSGKIQWDLVNQGIRDNDREAFYILGEATLQGIDVQQDDARGIALLKQAADMGSIPAIQALAGHYFYGANVERSDSEAEYWIKVGIARGDPQSIKVGKRWFP